jgi:hypothetical protein
VATIDEQLRLARGVGDSLWRDLNAAEERIARQVFQDTLKLSHVSIAAGIGLHDRPWTTPDVASHFFSLGFYQAHTIHVGPEGFVLGMESTPTRQETLVHELTHVWQAQVAGGYLTSAAWHQVVDHDPYQYQPGQRWDAYNVEAQAQIVEDWYARGALEDGTSDLFPYIRDVIRSPPDLLPLDVMIFPPYHR